MDQRFIEKFEYFIERTDQDLSEIKVKVNSLWNFKMLLLGASMTISLLASALVSVMYLYFETKPF